MGKCPGMGDSAVARHAHAACVLDCPEPDAAEVPEELQGIGFVKVRLLQRLQTSSNFCSLQCG